MVSAYLMKSPLESSVAVQIHRNSKSDVMERVTSPSVPYSMTLIPLRSDARCENNVSAGSSPVQRRGIKRTALVAQKQVINRGSFKLLMPWMKAPASVNLELSIRGILSAVSEFCF